MSKNNYWDWVYDENYDENLHEWRLPYPTCILYLPCQVAGLQQHLMGCTTWSLMCNTVGTREPVSRREYQVSNAQNQK